MRNKPFRYDPHGANGADDSNWNDKTLLAQLMLLVDCGFYFHMSRLVNSPEKYQYLQVLFIRGLPEGVVNTVYHQALPKQLGLPNLVSYIDINEFVSVLYTPYGDSDDDLRAYFEDFQRDPARSGEFHHDPATWHAFAATQFLQFLATGSSQ